MNICIVTHMYPNKFSSSDFVFVKKLVDEFARQGHSCCVVSPFNFLHYRGIEKSCSQYEVDGKVVRTIRPLYLSFGYNRFLAKIAQISHRHSYEKSFRMMERSGFIPDVIYCHFWSSGICAYRYAKKNNIPLFVASGESTIGVSNIDSHLNNFANYVKGVICVSIKNKNESTSNRLTTEEKCIVVPNAINDAVFHKMDKSECRKKLNLPQDKFIIAFVGYFRDRKGPLRVAEAINKIETNDVYSLFIGSGEQNPTCNNVLFKGRVDNTKLPEYLNAADAFVLPTLHEGCCNAIVEAMACGLPIISSNLPFNWDVLNDSNSIMIDPNDVDDIANAIITLKSNDKLRQKLSDGSLSLAANLTIRQRAKTIIDFMKSKSCLNILK